MSDDLDRPHAEQSKGTFWFPINDHGYTCPVLMHLTMLVTRHARWEKTYGVSYPNRYFWAVVVRPPGIHHGWEPRCLFPTWMIRAECWFWNSYPGLLLRYLCKE